MTATILIPLVVAVLGALIYVVSVNPKLAELGRLAYGCGLLAVCLAYVGHTVHVG